ncbi:MAG: hypothetical protein AAFQ14_16610 [Cyanobacteria bacterium J06621_12]
MKFSLWQYLNQLFLDTLEPTIILIIIAFVTAIAIQQITNKG